MYIKEIKINSFKSFADKVNIQLDSNFTGIVGPNGSGKSNIVDAVKWVLGEQSVKTLRASTGMSDVIFSGSKSRNPSNTASVAITFDNSDSYLPTDYKEVTIKRVVSRSGENEYYINNEKCRLKDINDLMVDSFSSRESFNIIPQNKIEEILSDKPENRRIIFEEAAGVLKYKKRKEETLKKLARTHENIDRVDMIIEELKNQVEPLEQASKKAKIYKETRDKLESLDVALMVSDITSFSEVLKNKKEELDKCTLEFESTNKENAKENTEIEKLKLESLKLDEKLSDLRSKHLKSKELLSELLSKKEMSIERSKYDKNSDEVKTRVISLRDKELKLSNDIKSLESDLDLNKSLGKDKLDELNSLNKNLQEENKNLSIKNGEYNDLKRKELEINSKIELLNSSIENNSKLPYSVKSVLGNPTLNGVLDYLGNIIDTKEEYLTMLDISLGSSYNCVITEDEDSAKKAIEYLKVNNKGRVTFFPLSVIRPKSIEPEVLNIAASLPGYLGIVSDLVNYDKKYYNIVKNQLGNIIAVDNIDNALNISRKINHRYRIVTLEGDILHVGGSLSGGSNKNNSVISDKNELDRLKVVLESIISKEENSKKEIEELEYNKKVIEEKILNINVEITKYSEIVNSKNISLSSLKEELNSVKNEINDLSKKESVDKSIDKLMKEYYEEEERCLSLEKEIELESSNKREVMDKLTELESLLKKTISSSSTYQNTINELNVDIVKLNMNLDNLLNRLGEEYSLTYEGAKDKYSLDIEEKEARKIVSELKKTIKSIGNVNLESIEEYERVNKRYTFLNTQKEDLLKSEKDLLEIINNMDDIMKDKFESTFHKINEEFSKVFKNLFGGGEASLSLTEPNNILETGIEIVAIPPGKNLKPLSLLSGGEKTLTAISLLFSIMNLKKVPFVILDEVESALDEVNAEKFGEYLSNYRNRTQLLIITHKKKTMEYLDLLYGITMQESGVSKLVSVKLENI